MIWRSVGDHIVIVYSRETLPIWYLQLLSANYILSSMTINGNENLPSASKSLRIFVRDNLQRFPNGLNSKGSTVKYTLIGHLQLHVSFICALRYAALTLNESWKCSPETHFAFIRSFSEFQRLNETQLKMDSVSERGEWMFHVHLRIVLKGNKLIFMYVKRKHWAEDWFVAQNAKRILIDNMNGKHRSSESRAYK